MENKKGIRNHKFAVIFITSWTIFCILTREDGSNNYNQGKDFPKPDPSKGQALGYDYKKGEYKYESHWPKGKPLKETKVDKGKPYIHQEDVTEDIDPQEIRDYYGY